MQIFINRIDHLVFTVRNIEATINFYTRTLGMKEETFGNGRKALVFGNQKWNLHQKGFEFEPKAQAPTPGAIDIWKNHVGLFQRPRFKFNRGLKLYLTKNVFS